MEEKEVDMKTEKYLHVGLSSQVANHHRDHQHKTSDNNTNSQRSSVLTWYENNNQNKKIHSQNYIYDQMIVYFLLSTIHKWVDSNYYFDITTFTQ